MSLVVEPLPPDQQPNGDVARFEYRNDTHAFTARGTVRRGENGLTISRLEISPDNGDISIRVLRSIPLGELLGRLRESVPAPIGQVTASVASSRACTCAHRHGGRTPLTDDHLRSVAVAYLEETGPGKGRGALQRVVARFDRPEGTVRTWLRMARREGWLGPGMQGRAGAEPGPRLRAAKEEPAA